MKSTGFDETENINENFMRKNAWLGKENKVGDSLSNPKDDKIVGSVVTRPCPMNMIPFYMHETLTEGNEFMIAQLFLSPVIQTVIISMFVTGQI